jgi:hypothetical protein
MFICLCRVPVSLPARPGHKPSADHIICRASRHLIRRATSCDRPILTSSGWPFLLLGNFFSVFVISTFSVITHSLILGSVQHLYASYIYVLFLPPPPTLFSLVLLLAYSSQFSHMCTHMCYLFGGLLVSCYFLSSSKTSGLILTTLPAVQQQ